MKKILFLVAHPHLEKSRVNREILKIVESLPGVSTLFLYDLYPNFNIDVETEKKRLLEHDLIVFQHPFYWYNMPPLLKLWLDEVLASGWAYGNGGDRLQGKQILVSITTGGPQDSYQPQGFNLFTIDQLLAPWRLVAERCKMKWFDPYVLHKAHDVSRDQVDAHALKLRHALQNYQETGELR